MLETDMPPSLPSSPVSSLPSSPLSSIASRSPSPPIDYPSPPFSNVSDAGASAQKRVAPESSQDRDDPQPAKRQRIMNSKEQKTEYLNLNALNESDNDEHHHRHDPKLRKLMEALRSKRKIVVIAGAGISVSAGIPDFRSSTGLFSTLRAQHGLKASGKHLFDASVYRSDSSTSSFHDMVRDLSHLTQNAKPTAFHHMLATLAEEGRLMRLYSQNVDGIETSLEPLATNVPLNPKGPWPKTIQLHGGLEKMVCTKCGQLRDFDGSLFEGPEPPSCQECEFNDSVRVAAGLRSHGIGRLRPRMVLYNEYNPDEDAIGNVSHADLRNRPDAVIVVGTSLKVPGIRRLVKELCAVTRGRRGGFTAWINLDPEPIGIDFKDCWDMVVRGECDEVARLVGLPRWDDKDCGDYRLVEGEVKPKSLLGVVVESKTLSVTKTQGILTPSDSPRQQSPTPLSGATKLKQQPLSFGSTLSVPKKDANIKKKQGRKPLPTKPMKASNKITNAFAATKTSKKTTSKPAYSEEENKISSPRSRELFPGLTTARSSSPMRPISPCDNRNNSDVIPFAEVVTPKSVKFSVEIPPYDREETISPKGRLPSGMAALLS